MALSAFLRLKVFNKAQIGLRVPYCFPQRNVVPFPVGHVRDSVQVQPLLLSSLTRLVIHPKEVSIDMGLSLELNIGVIRLVQAHQTHLVIYRGAHQFHGVNQALLVGNGKKFWLILKRRVLIRSFTDLREHFVEIDLDFKRLLFLVKYILLFS